MTVERVRNILSLLCTIAGLLSCTFKYIEKPRRGFRYLIGFFLATFLSEYYRTIYEFVMHAYPAVSEFTANLGWNISYVFLLLAVLHTQSPEARRFFHPVLALPVGLVIPQLVLRLRGSEGLNSIWQSGITAVIMVFCLQNMLFHRKRRKTRKDFPWLSLLILAVLFMKCAMWTSSCFEWNSELLSPSFVFAVAGSLISVFLAYGMSWHYEAEETQEKTWIVSEMQFRVVMQAVAALVIIVLCGAGFFVAVWVKNGIAGSGASPAESRMVFWLFAISAALILLILGLVYGMTFRYRRTIRKFEKVSSRKTGRMNFIFTLAMTLALMAFAVVYNNLTFYNASVVAVYEDGENAIKAMATDFENNLTVASTTLRVTADSVDLMKAAGQSVDDIERYIVEQTTRQAEQFDENFTGLYAYIDGRYLDGVGWVPPEDYEPTSRDWYRIAVEAGGEVVLVSPYLDAQTGSVVLTIAQGIAGGEPAGKPIHNVIALDMAVNHIQEVTESIRIADKGYGMVVNTDGFIVAHQDRTLNGKYTSEIYGPELLDSIRGAKSSRMTVQMDGEKTTMFISPVMEQWYAVIAIRNAELLEGTRSQLAVNIMVSLLTFCLISLFYFIGYKNEQIFSKKVEEMNLQVVTALATAIDAKDPYTKGHSTRVSQYSVLIAEALGWDRNRIEELRIAALLHDIGKIGIPDSILNKPGRLTDVEFSIIKSHTTMGGEILRGRTVVGCAEDVALSHHERVDGTGYPQGLRGEEMTDEARIVSIADAFDAMNSSRVYRKACSREYILGQLKEGREKQFDAGYVDVLIRLWNEGRLEESLKRSFEDERADRGIEASFHEAVEKFVTENTPPETLVENIQKAGDYHGALNVDYSQFARLYDFIANLAKRFNHPFKLVLITLEIKPGVEAPVSLENAMFYMDRAIRISIRDVDIVTRYNRQQFLVIMLGTESEGVKTAMARIFMSYFRMNGSNAFPPTYTILEPQNGDGK